MTGAVDLKSHAATLAGLAAQVAATPTGATAMRVLASEILALAPSLASAPATSGPTEWSGVVADDVFFASGPGVEFMVDGPLIAPRSVHVVVGERALMVLPTGGAQRVRLLDGIQVLADRTFPLVGESIDHLDAEAAVQRSLARVDRALDRRPADPEDATEPPPPLEGSSRGAGASGGLGGALGQTAAGAGLAAAVGAVARARRPRRAPLTAPGHDETGARSPEAAAQPVTPSPAAPWAATHVVPPGGLGARAQADADAPPTARLDPGVELRVVREWGAWAEVDASNGWTGWVDGRRLMPIV